MIHKHTGGNTPLKSQESMRSSTQSLNEKTFEIARKIHEDISRHGGKAFEAKKRFLNWDPVALMRGEEFNPNEIIRKTQKI